MTPIEHLEAVLDCINERLDMIHQLTFEVDLTSLYAARNAVLEAIKFLERSKIF
jgi:hypothetical protein